MRTMPICAKRTLGWMALVGAILSLLGTFVLVADQVGLSGFINAVTGFGRLQAGWEKLCDNPGQEQILLRPLDPDHPGFLPLLDIILSHQEEYHTADVLQVLYHASFGFEMGETYFPEEYIAIRRRGQETPDVIGTKEYIEQRISIARLQTTSLTGFLVIFFGVVLSIPAILQHAITTGRGERKQRPSQYRGR